ncbi:MAG: [FeFe] hydrogenase H-cluster radical SAM maturase HydE [Bacteriovoracia bacterium]
MTIENDRKWIEAIVDQNIWDINIVSKMLQLSEKTYQEIIFPKALEEKKKFTENFVYYRGLVEFSNICSKDCFYCGIRKSNQKIKRYTVSTDEVIDAVRFAYENNYASVVLQSGELNTPAFTEQITHILERIRGEFDSSIRVTLSCGEQNREVYKKWFQAGAHRYLLRVETSNEKLYERIHPQDEKHSLAKRVKALEDLKAEGYQVGSGIMVGFPGQKLEDIACDLLFLKKIDIDMCGLGPYIEHPDTPLYHSKESILSRQERFQLTLKCIAILRLMMKDINIASATALQAIDPAGREKALLCGTNVIMPNLTPVQYRESYKLYSDKPCVDEDRSQCLNCLETRVRLYGHQVGYKQWGDSKHFTTRKNISHD